LIGLIAEVAGETTERSASPRSKEAPAPEPCHAPSTNSDR
jgi:hypothetical protein